MGEPAKKLPPTPAEPEMPALEPGDTELEGLIFPLATRLGSSVMVGRNYDFEFGCSGVVQRIAIRKNGTVSVQVRTGGQFTGGKLSGYRFRELVFFANGMYGAAPANDNGSGR